MIPLLNFLYLLGGWMTNWFRKVQDNKTETTYGNVLETRSHVLEDPFELATDCDETVLWAKVEDLMHSLGNQNSVYYIARMARAEIPLWWFENIGPIVSIDDVRQFIFEHGYNVELCESLDTGECRMCVLYVPPGVVFDEHTFDENIEPSKDMFFDGIHEDLIETDELLVVEPNCNNEVVSSMDQIDEIRRVVQFEESISEIEGDDDEDGRQVKNGCESSVTYRNAKISPDLMDCFLAQQVHERLMYSTDNFNAAAEVQLRISLWNAFAETLDSRRTVQDCRSVIDEDDETQDYWPIGPLNSDHLPTPISDEETISDTCSESFDDVATRI